jgi:hypothetical protein
MDVVEKRVAHTGVMQGAGELGFPDAFGEPGAFGALAEVMLTRMGS